MAERQFDLTRDTLAVVFLFALIAASVWILLPFLAAVVWATMIVVATWPMLLTLQRWLLGRRWLAVTVMTLLLLAIFLLPFSFAIGAFVENFKEITDLDNLALHSHTASASRLAGKDPSGRRAGDVELAATRRAES